MPQLEIKETDIDWIRLIRWILAVSIVVSCLGYLINTLKYEDKVFSFLWNEHYLDWSESLALRVSEWGAISMVLAAILGSFRRFRFLQLWVFLWLLFTVYCSYLMAYWHPGYLWGTSAIRLTSPLLLFALFSFDWKLQPLNTKLKILEWGMRLSIALTFFYHGHECLANKAIFLDYIQSTGRLIGMDGISSASAQSILKIIGILDVVIAIALLIPVRLRFILYWMSFWGLATGFIRIVFAGWINYPEFMIRMIHGTLPICLILLWKVSTDTKIDLKQSEQKEI